MAKLKNPLLSLKASGSVGRVITFLRRGKVYLVEKKPEIKDAKTEPQLAWRHMFNKCVDLWHLLSPAEKQEWESTARSRHMTGYAWYISQCLRPNPGIYLPLQGGTMSGDIDMAKNRLLRLPAPTDGQEAANKAYADAPGTTQTKGARVSHSVAQAIPHATFTYLAFDTEGYDTDTIHDTVVNNDRLTCKTAGKYLVVAGLYFTANASGVRFAALFHNVFGVTARVSVGLSADNLFYVTLSSIVALAVNEFMRVRVYQNSGAAINVPSTFAYSPVFMMQRIG